MTPGDAEAYWLLRLEALESRPRAFSASPERHRERGVAGVAGMIESIESDRFNLGAWDGDVLVGTAGLLREPEAAARHRGFVWGVYVTPRARGRGVGEAMLRELIRRAKGWSGFERIVLDVYAGNPAVRLYERMGFRPFGEARIEEIDDEALRPIQMALDLR